MVIVTRRGDLLTLSMGALSLLETYMMGHFIARYVTPTPLTSPSVISVVWSEPKPEVKAVNFAEFVRKRLMSRVTRPFMKY